MPLPELDHLGELPAWRTRATLAEVAQRFGSATGLRGACTRRLAHLYELARRTGYLQRFIVFGSYITAKPSPNDVDVILVLEDAFRLEECPIE